jgi:hypothetical protein
VVVRPYVYSTCTVAAAPSTDAEDQPTRRTKQQAAEDGRPGLEKVFITYNLPISLVLVKSHAHGMGPWTVYVSRTVCPSGYSLHRS